MSAHSTPTTSPPRTIGTCFRGWGLYIYIYKVSGFRNSFRVPGLWLPGGVSVSGVLFPGLGFGVRGPWFRVQGVRFRVQVSGVRFPGFGFRVEFFGFRVEFFCVSGVRTARKVPGRLSSKKNMPSTYLASAQYLAFWPSTTLNGGGGGQIAGGGGGVQIPSTTLIPRKHLFFTFQSEKIVGILNGCQ